jgi:DNA-binding NarL/FixJ family response regulator
MDEATSAAIAVGQRALETGDWVDAREAFGAVLAGGEPEALDGYGLAIWFLGDVDEGMELRQRACLAYGERGDCDRAARLAAWVSHQFLVSGRTSLSNGWLARAERVLEGRVDCSGAGWVRVERARRGTLDECLDAAGYALEIGRACGDDDLEVFALSMLGRAEVSQGRFDEGMLRLEEAMAAATAGRIRNPNTLGEAYCNLISASTSAGDWERAAEWCEYVDEFASRRAMVPLYGACRTIHADVLVAAGRWTDAEQALTEALDAHARHYPAMGGPTVATLALLRLRQGRLPEAEALVAGREEHAAVLLALAELRLAEGRPEVAAALLERGLASSAGDMLASSRLLAPLVSAHLALGDRAAACDAAARLARLADDCGRLLVQARAQLAAAQLALADRDAVRAQAAARLALDAFARLGMPYEAAEARLELARALAARGHPLAIEDARAALAAFRELGATRAVDAAAALLRELGAGSAPGARIDGELTRREREVLALLARGMTNAQIGASLFISTKTAGHHVSRILAKLGARNRAEAAAYAVSLGHAGPE